MDKVFVCHPLFFLFSFPCKGSLPKYEFCFFFFRFFFFFFSIGAWSMGYIGKWK